MYEGALRRGEVLGIRFKHITFKGDYANLYIAESKTKGRNIPLFDSIPYLKEWFNVNSFEQNGYIFEYKNARNLNSSLYNIRKRLIIKDGKKWKTKRLNPHIFRHSRLTELAIDDFNEPSLRKFAGWTKDSQMAKIYFHITDQDLIKKMKRKRNLLPKPEETKPKTHEPKYCPICKAENANENVYCWKCSNSFGNVDILKDIFIQPDKFKQLREENKELQQKLSQMEESIIKVNEILPNLIKSNDFFQNQYNTLCRDTEHRWPRECCLQYNNRP